MRRRLVTYSPETTFHALADPTRRAVLDMLRRGDQSAGLIAQAFPVSRPAISKHLDVLERAGLLHRVPDGRVNRCRFDGAPLRDAFELMEDYRGFWDDQMDKLTGFFQKERTR